MKEDISSRQIQKIPKKNYREEIRKLYAASNSNQVAITKPDLEDFVITDAIPALKSFPFSAFRKYFEGEEKIPLIEKDLDEDNGIFRRWVKPFKKKDTKT